MLNIIVKDLYQSRKTILMYMVLGLVMIASFTLTNLGTGAISGFLVVMVYGVITRNEYYEDKNNGYKLLRILPIKPYKIVISKYISTFILTVISAIYGYIAQMGILKYFVEDSLGYTEEVIPIVITSTCVALLFVGVFYILMFRVGAVKAINYSRIVFFLLFFGFMFGIGFIKMWLGKIDSSRIEGYLSNISGPMVVAMTLIIYLITMIISIRNFETKKAM